MKKSIPSSFLVSLLLGVINTLPAGVVYTLKTTEFLDTKSSGTMTVFIEGKNLKMEIKDQGSSNTTILFKGEDNSMTMVDDERQQYMVMDEATIKQLAGQMSQAMAQYEQMLKNVPPQQRAMMEEMMKKQMGNMMPQSVPTVESKLSKGGQSKTVAGYKTTHFQQKRDGQLTSEYWAVGWDKIEGGDEVQEAFLGMAKFQDNLTKAFTQGGSNPMMGMVKSMSDNMFKQMSKMNGFPVSVINYKDGTKSRESVLESIDIRTLDPEAFEPPNGYKRQRMGGR